MRPGILVTGGAGFIGSHLVERLLRAGEAVTVLDDFNSAYPRSQKWNNLDSALRDQRFRLVVGDIRNAANVRDALRAQPVDRVVHLAARAGVQPSLRDPVLYADVNVTGTAVVLEASAATGIRQVVMASSSSVYGANARIPFQEHHRVDRPMSPYAASKRANELQCQTFSDLTGIPVTCLRFFTAYGPRQRPDMAIHHFAQALVSGQPITVYGQDARRDFTYVGDIVDGVIGALEHPCGFLICNLGRGEPVSVDLVVERLQRLLGRTGSVNRSPLPPGDVPITWADIGVARRLLGYEPSIQLDDGLERFVRWFLGRLDVNAVATPVAAAQA